MIRFFASLWCDERGAVSAMSFLLLTSVLALGCIVGLTTVRDQIVQEMGDISLALENINQSYSTSMGTFTDPGPFTPDVANTAPACLEVCSPISTP